MTKHEAYLAKLVSSGALTEKEMKDLLKLYDQARAELRATGRDVTRQEAIEIYNSYKLIPSEEELDTQLRSAERRSA